MKALPLTGAIVMALAAASPALAQQSAPQDAKQVEKITVTASPLGRATTEMAQPATVLTEDDLRRKRAASIGDTLSSETGVQSSAFGAGAGRPVIRGLDGARIRVLENGIGTLDASSVSPDHMVTTESLNASQIEILRGPASLLYGSGAIGGIVNVVSNLIPREPAMTPSGSAEARVSSANRERTGALNIGGGSGSFAWHLDGFRRKTVDYRIPGRADRTDPDSATGRLPDSFVDSGGAGAGASWVGARGYLGAGAQGLESDYGIPSGEGTRIKVRQKRYESASEVSNPLPGLTRFKFRLAHTDYRHEEIEAGGEVGTTFESKATESRFEMTHAPWSGMTGTFGLQLQDRELVAIGAEAVFPRTRSRAAGIFLVEQADIGSFTFDAGVRVERETRRPRVAAEDIERFGTPESRDFNLFTPAVGVVWKFAGAYRLALSATQAQRAPSGEELYSNGPHAATASFEVGNPGLRREVSRNVDLTLRKATGETRWKINAFANRIRDYIHAASEDVDGDGTPDRIEDFLLQRYVQGDSRFYGLEAEWSYRPESGLGGVRVFGDNVRARLAGSENLPRISPSRVGVEFDRKWGAWSAHLSAIRAFEQRRTAPLERATPAYTRVDGEIAWELGGAKGANFTLFMQGSNLLDEEIRLHTSYLKEVAPLMGRSFTLGLRAAF